MRHCCTSTWSSLFPHSNLCFSQVKHLKIGRKKPDIEGRYKKDEKRLLNKQFSFVEHVSAELSELSPIRGGGIYIALRQVSLYEPATNNDHDRDSIYGDFTNFMTVEKACSVQDMTLSSILLILTRVCGS